MKPEFSTNGVNSAVSYKKSSKEGCSISDSKTNNEELDEISSELWTKINNFFEVHNSFLYEDVHENPSDLERYLSTDPTSDAKINGNCSHEDETVEDENSEDNQKLHSSTKNYEKKPEDVEGSSEVPSEGGNINIQSAKKSLGNRHLSPFEIVKIPSLPDSFQLPISNETGNTVTFDSFSSENNFIDIKFPTFNSSSLSQDLTKAQRSVRLNKKSNLKKIIKKSTNEKLTVPYKTKECLSPKDVISRDMAEKSKLENVAPVLHNLEINSSLDNHCDLSENEEQIYQRVLQSAYDPQYPRVYVEDIFKMNLNNKNQALCVEKALFKLGSKSREKLQSEVKTMGEKNAGKTSKKALNSGKNLKKNKALSSEAKNNLNETNDSVKAKGKTFTQNQSSFSNQSKLSKKSITILEENLSKKSKLRVCNNSVKEAAEEVSLKKKIASRKKSFPQEISKIEAKIDKKNTPKNKAALEKEDILNDNNVEVTDLLVNEIGSDLINNKITANKNLNTKIKARKSASKKKVVLENEDILDDNDIVDNAAVHAKESRNNLRKDDIIAADKSFNTKIEIKKSTRKRKSALENNEDVLNKNKIVENTNLTINKIGKDLKKNKVEAADKHLNTKIQIKKSTQKKKTALENNEDVLNKNKVVENTNLTINEIGKDLKKNKVEAADKHLNTKIKVNRKNTLRKKTALEKEDILNKNNITENINLPVDEIGTDLIKNKTVADDQNQKSMQLYKTSTPVSQNSSMKNIFDSLNKNTKNTALPGTPQANSSSFLQLFNKIRESNRSETFSKTNNSFAKLFEQRSTSKFTAISKITTEFNQKQDEEQLLQPNSSKGNNINLSNFKSFTAVKEKSVKISPLGKKRSNEDNAEGTPLKKKKQNQDPIERNNEKNLNGEVSSYEDSDEHYNDKISKTTKKQLVQSIVSKPSRRSSKRNQKLDGESNITSDLCNQEKRKSVKKSIEDGKSLAKSQSSCNPANVIEASSKRNSRTKNSTKINSVDAQNSHEIKGKANSLLSTESESLYNDRFDACSFIKVVEVKSLANLNEKKNKNGRRKKSNSFTSDSFSEDSKAMEKSEEQLQSPVSDFGQKNRRKNKHLHLTPGENSCATQSAENAAIELNCAGRLTRIKRKIRTNVDPDFTYEVKTRRIKKEDKSLSDHKNGIESPIVKKSPSKLMRCNETDFIKKMPNADTTQEDANEHGVQIYNGEEQVCNLNSNGVPMNSLNSEQFKGFLSSYTLYPLNTPQCHILYSAELNSTLLAVPIESSLNLNSPALMPSTVTNDNMPGTPFQAQSYPLQSFPISPFISSTQTPVLSTCTIKSTRKQTSSSLVNSHHAASVASDQNVPSLITNRNILSKEKPQTISSAVNSKNASVTGSKENSDNSYSNSFVNNVHPVRISPSKAAWSVEALQTPSDLLNPESDLCIDWESILLKSFELIEVGFIEKLSKNAFGKKLQELTVGEFCSNPVVVHHLSKPLKLACTDSDVGKFDYCFPDSILDEPFKQVLIDVVIFFFRHMPEALGRSGNDLKAFIFNAIYSKFSMLVAMLFSNLAPTIITDLTFDEMAGVVCLVSVIYVFYHCKKKIKM